MYYWGYHTRAENPGSPWYTTKSTTIAFMAGYPFMVGCQLLYQEDGPVPQDGDGTIIIRDLNLSHTSSQQ